MKRVVLGGVAMAMAITANAAELTAKENAIVDIGAWTARGELKEAIWMLPKPRTSSSRSTTSEPYC